MFLSDAAVQHPAFEFQNERHIMKHPFSHFAMVGWLVASQLMSMAQLCGAENVFGATDPTKPIIVKENEAIIITAHSKWTFLKIRIGDLEAPAFLEYGLEGFAIGGPAEVHVLDDSPKPFMQFVRRSNSPIRTVLSTPQRRTELVIPPGKTAHFLQTFNETETLAHIQQGTDTYQVNLLRGTELSGPLTLRFQDFHFGEGAMGTRGGSAVSFYFTEEGELLPDLAAIKTPTGNFQLTIDQSQDLKRWFPRVISEVTSEEPRFFRLRVEK